MKQALVVAFAFGAPYDILSNRRIAEIATKKAEELNAQIFTQFDVLIKKNLQIKYIDKVNRETPGTFGLARSAVKYAVEQNCEDIWVVAAKPHLSRCMRDMECVIIELGAVNLNIFVCKEIELYFESEWYCPNSQQRCTCSLKEWKRRECLIKKIPMFVYKIFAG